MRFGLPRELRDAATADPPMNGRAVAPARPDRVRNERLVIDMGRKVKGLTFQVKRQPAGLVFNVLV